MPVEKVVHGKLVIRHAHPRERDHHQGLPFFIFHFLLRGRGSKSEGKHRIISTSPSAPDPIKILFSIILEVILFFFVYLMASSTKDFRAFAQSFLDS